MCSRLTSAASTTLIPIRSSNGRVALLRTPSGPPPAAGPPAYYNPVTPARVLDTRLGTGGFTGRLGYGCHINVQVLVWEACRLLA